MKTLVSVIIPCYNHEQFVQATIQSIIDQDYQYIELIIIDDGSKDNSVQLIEDMRGVCEKRFVHFEFRHRPNKGLCVTLNEAISLSRGSFIAISASDDISLNTRITQSMLAIEENEADVVFGNVIKIDSCSRQFKPKNIESTQITFEDVFLRKIIPFAPTALFRASSLKLVGGFDPNFKIEDYGLWLKMTNLGYKLINIDNYLVMYRLHGNNLSGNLNLLDAEVIKILNEYSTHELSSMAIEIYKTLMFSRWAEVDKFTAIKIFCTSKLKYKSRVFMMGAIKVFLPNKVILWIQNRAL